MSPLKLFALPNTLHFIASPLDIDDVSTPLHIGQLFEFVRPIDSAGSIILVGLSSYQTCSSLSSDENSDVRLGSRAHEVTIGQSVKQDDATSRVEVVPTGRVLGEVIGTYVDNVTVLLKIEDWFTESGMFEMGRWRDVVNEQVQADDELGMEVAVLE
ncbi:hypothetical protein HO173_010930 [Letharia columbiana]|uniref:Uncharacterized protein n=1 Tax=Letharia columbiana TaxID=112416 RepID=A0A8H6FLM4_9LECA|nr:uncharacterized protein HO173_010930 [Letharia columbiana]KAF6230814.1 hypothetical protein HO173_010930 [Letharia columbiana]